MREAAYKGLVRPILEYGSSVWDPHYEGLIDDLEKVQKRSARFVPRNYTYEKGSMTDILKKLLEDHWSCSSPERLSHCKLMRFKLIENRPMKVYAWTLLTPGAWPNLTQGHDWHNL